MKRQKKDVDSKQTKLSFFKPLTTTSNSLIPTGEILSFEWDHNESKTIQEKKEILGGILYEDKYKPLNEKDIVGQSNALQALKLWKSGGWKTKPLLLGGPSGSGKTSLINVVFHDYKIWNESYLKEDETLLQGLKSLLERKPLFEIKRCVVIDCLEGLQTPEINEIYKVLKEKKDFFYPVILTCDDEYDLPNKDLVKYCTFIKTVPISKQCFFQIIKSVVDKEELSISSETIETLYDNCAGNIRFGLNELQFLLQTRKRTLKKDSVSSLCKKDSEFQLFGSSQQLFSGVPLTEEFLNQIHGETGILSKMVHENAVHINDFKFWDFLSMGDILEYKNDELASYLTASSTVVFSQKMKFNGPRKLNFPTYFAFDNKKLRNEAIKKKSGLDKLPLQKWVYN
jgi:hypothetical protein